MVISVNYSVVMIHTGIPANINSWNVLHRINAVIEMCVCVSVGGCVEFTLYSWQ